MYNNFSSKKTKKVISALLASALVVTSAPISADAAIVKPLGVGKSFTVSGKKVTKLDSKEKKVVSVSIKNGKVTVKGKKAGKVSFKIGNKTYNVNVGATKVTATAAATTLKVNDKTTVAIKATNGAKDKLTIKTSKSSVVKIGKSSVTADKNGKASVTLRGLAAGTSTITVKSANTGMYAKVKITVKADETATAAPSSDAPATLAPATDSPVGPTAVPTTGGAVTTAPTSGGAVTATPAPTATASAVTGSVITAIAQTGRNTITVTGSGLTANVDDYTVKKGTSSTVTVTKVVLNADKTSASLTVNSSYLAETDYTVVVGATSLSFKGVAEKVTKIEIVGDKLVVTDVSGNPSTTTAVIEYYVLNQFGEKMEDTDINVTAAITGMSVNAGAAIDAKKGKNGVITLTGNTADLTMGQKGSIVLVDKTNGINVSKVITLSNIATVTSAEYVGLYKDYNDDTNRKLVTSFDDSATASDYSLLFKVKDQYGNAVKASKLTAAEITVTANGTAGLTTGTFNDVTINDEDYVAYTLAGVPTVGVSTYTFVGNKTGLLANVTVNVTKQVSLASLKISPKETIYNNTPVEVEYTAVDTDGNEVTDYSKLSKLAPVGTTFAVTSNRNATATGTFAWSQATDGKAVLTYTPSYVDFTGSNNKETTLLPITVKCGTNNVQVYNFTVNYQKEATSIEGVDSTVALAAITKTGKIALTMADFVIVDQYNNPLSDTEAASLVGAIGVKYLGASTGFEMTDVSSNATSAVNAGTPATIDATNYNAKAIAATTDKVLTLDAKATEGSTDLEFVLGTITAGAFTPEPNSATTLTIKSVGIDKVSNYTVKDVLPLYVDPSAGARNSTQSVVVTGKIGSTVVALDTTEYSIIGTNHIAVSGANLTAQGDVIYADAAKTTYGNVTETIEVVINDTNATSIKKDITVSSKPSVINSVALTTGTTLTDTISVAVGNTDTVAISDLIPQLTVKDQYGLSDETVAALLKDTTGVNNVRVKFTDLPEFFTVDKNNTTEAKLVYTPTAAKAEHDNTIGVTFTFANGLTFTKSLVVKTTATDAVAPVENIAPSATGTVAANAESAEITVRLGSGTLAATRIASVTCDDAPYTAATADIPNAGQYKFDGTTLTINFGSPVGASKDIVIRFDNDASATVRTATE